MTEESTHADPKDPRVVDAAREYFDLLDRGIAVDREQFIAQNPHIAQRLRSALVDEDERRRLRAAGSAAARELTGGSTGAFTRHGLDTLPPPPRSEFGAAACHLPPGAQFGRYRIVRVLGRGAMGTVYLALDTQLDREVALKTPQFDQDSDLLERFHREARAAAALRHPNICPIYDFGQIDKTHFISMAYIEGESLAALVGTDQPQPAKRILIIARKIAEALQEAHEHGIVHRDLKPSNVMLDKRGEPIVMDFGLARQMSGHDNVRLTQSGILVGTPAFMSPEQIEGDLELIGPATDQYSLGVLLYELFTQQLPFRGSSMAIIAQALVKEPPPPIQLRSDLDPRINAACLKMMAKAPDDRFASLAAVADELQRILDNSEPKSIFDFAPAKPSTPLSAERAAARQRRQSLAAQFLAKRSLSEEELVAIEKSARKQFDLRQYEKVVEMLGQIAEEQRPARLQGLLADARCKAAEIAALVTSIDEAVSQNDRTTALERSQTLLKIQPGNSRACEVRKQLDGNSTLEEIWKIKPRTLWTVVVLVLVVLAALVAAAVVGRTTEGADQPKAVTGKAADAQPLPPTYANVVYGPHERNVLDFWKADGAGPRPLLISIHGGGWVGGDKKQNPAAIRPWLAKGISYAAINYRLTGKAPLPAPVHDAARAVQFLRSKAAAWNINQDRIALTGGSAGACTSMWILLHDDLADPKSDDPVLRESTRVSAAAVTAGQTSIDPKVIVDWVGPNVLKHQMIWMAVGEKTMGDALKNYDQHRATYVEFSPYNHLDAKDPPLFMTYDGNMTLPSENAGHGIHHPLFGVKLKEKSDRVGHECYLLIKGVSKPAKYANATDFLTAKLLAP